MESFFVCRVSDGLRKKRIASLSVYVLLLVWSLFILLSGDEEDYSCLKTCGFVSFEHLMQSRCLVKCKCMQVRHSPRCYDAKNNKDRCVSNQPSLLGRFYFFSPSLI